MILQDPALVGQKEIRCVAVIILWAGRRSLKGS